MTEVEIVEAIQEYTNQRDSGGSETIKVGFFLFHHDKPTYQSQAVAQVISETKVGANISDVKMWVDALREEELSDENLEDIRVPINMINSHTKI
jgi:cation transport regulator ChaC